VASVARLDSIDGGRGVAHCKASAADQIHPKTAARDSIEGVGPIGARKVPRAFAPRAYEIVAEILGARLVAVFIRGKFAKAKRRMGITSVTSQRPTIETGFPHYFPIPYSSSRQDSPPSSDLIVINVTAKRSRRLCIRSSEPDGIRQNRPGNAAQRPQARR